MSYIVLARKYRPSTFDELIGQSHITNVLKNAVSSGRLAHAYLFCGPRGIGKTSCARILAKSLNCEKGPTIKPCNNCYSCQEIAKGTNFDVIEIDGASNRGIDEIRTLRENVKFAPGYGRYKIYIVDEVHMLTTEAFNALLKTLEEPPEHVKFIFATTEPHKLPATIISRCQRFDFKRISVNNIVSVLEGICKKEKIKIDKEGVVAIAKAAMGSMRDALSILDQLSGMGAGRIQAADVTAMLGTVEIDMLFKLTDCLANGDGGRALALFDELIEKGKDIRQFNKDLIEHFRNLMVIKVGGETLRRLIDYPVDIKKMYLRQTEKFSLRAILGGIELWISAQDMARITQSQRIPMEVAIAKFIARTKGREKKETGSSVKKEETKTEDSKGGGFTPLKVFSNEKGQIDLSGREKKKEDRVREILDEEEEEDLRVGEELEGEITDSIKVNLEKIRKAWHAITYAISKERMSVATFLQEGSPEQFEEGRLTITFPEEASFHKEALEDKENLHLVEKVFSEKLRTPVQVHLRVSGSYKPPEEDPKIKEALKTFQGTVVNQWHKEG